MPVAGRDTASASGLPEIGCGKACGGGERGLGWGTEGIRVRGEVEGKTVVSVAAARATAVVAGHDTARNIGRSNESSMRKTKGIQVRGRGG